jgi:tRNA threonylcarbamoyladenosine biosynthesis protein TsaB
MNILAIDTSTRAISLAACRGKTALVTRNVVARRLMESNMVPNIDKVLRKAGWGMADVQAIVVGLGPGSFTGLRVGLATVKGLAFARPLPVAGVSSLDALARAAGNRAKNICVITDAKRGMVYHAGYEPGAGGLRKIAPDRLCGLDDVLDGLPDHSVVTGDAVALYQKEIARRAKAGRKSVLFTTERSWRPRAKYLAALAADRLARGESDDINTLLPLYLYPDDCQVRTGL